MVQLQAENNKSLAALGASEDDLIACLGKKWRIRVLHALDTQPLRFNAIQRQFHGLSAHILTKTLRDMERDGLVLRTLKRTRPPTVEYRLTAMGENMLRSLTPLLQWLSLNSERISKSRVRFDIENQDADEA